MTVGTGRGGASRPSFFTRWGMAITGIAGVLILVWLCLWQVERLAWKQDLIRTLEARLTAPAQPLPVSFDPESQEFTRVTITGRFDGAAGAHGFPDAPFLTSLRPFGPGYRIIQPFDTSDGRRVLVDRGFIPVAEKNRAGVASGLTAAPAGEITLTGALRWPDEGGAGDQSFGPDDNVWTNRNLAVMGKLFDAEPVLIVTDSSTAVGQWPAPDPIRSAAVRNTHFEYAITWGLLAVAWGAMTVWRLVKIRGEIRAER